MTGRYRILIVSVFAVLALASALLIPRLRFSFDFEQFFPQDDPDLEVFREFIREFETDDNFLLVAVRREGGVFEQSFLNRFHDFSLAARNLPHVVATQSLTQFGYPLRTPFGITKIPAIHRDEPARYAADRERLLGDPRFVHNLITADGQALVVFLKTEEAMQLDQARELMVGLDSLVQQSGFTDYHYLGRSYFQRELVAMQQQEVVRSAIISGILVTLLLFLIFRRPWGVVIAMSSISLGLLLFLGLLAALGRELNAMAALYPVLMIIVGTSDVIHIMTKYIDELREGLSRRDAIRNTIREIGLATLLTSATTAIGFSTLLSSRVAPIRDFGINAAMGVLVAYLTVILFTTALLTWFRTEQLIQLGQQQERWQRAMDGLWHFTRQRAGALAWGAGLVILLCAWGISRITTNYEIINNLPIGAKITEDFRFFEKELTGFRPLEFAVYAQNEYRADDYAVIREMDKLEQHLQDFPFLRGVTSLTAVYKSLNQMNQGNRADAYQLPPDSATFMRYQRFADRMPALQPQVLLSRDGKKARITSRIADIGADSIKYFGQQLDQWIATHLDAEVVQVKQTGTGLIIDKNAEYIRRSLLLGLGGAVIIIGLLMGALYRDWRMLLVAMIPNFFPLIIAGALLGFLGIELEATISIVFSVIFGIAVDDTIHFLSRYKLVRATGEGVDASLRITFQETGKAIILTSVILFFGFLVMLFSVHPPSVYVGLLISTTLFSALLADLLLMPLLIRWLVREG
ncbi:MAG: MMPL family transporter [Lewinellaceae bacterium]|nr:MMPL family transporter [Lewinellaceae bacterium]